VKFNKPLLAFILGGLATIPQQIITWVLLYLGLGKYSVYELNSLVITINRPNVILGTVSTFLVGGVIALFLFYFISKSGPEYVILKSIAAGLIGWVISEVIFTWLLEGARLIEIRPIDDYFLQLFGSIVFGLVLGLLFKKYLVPNSLTRG
jgi:hypothetical protein